MFKGDNEAVLPRVFTSFLSLQVGRCQHVCTQVFMLFGLLLFHQ